MVKFSKKWTINEAYSRLTSSIEGEILALGDLPRLQRACIREIKALGSNLPNKLIPQIDNAPSVNGLLDILTKSEYWNWFDTRLLTAVTQASGSPEAIKSLEKYKATYYRRKVSDLILCKYNIKPFKNFVPIVEKYKKDHNELTIFDLQKHQYEIEKVVEGGLVLIEIKTGCVELTWQIPQELVYRAYTSMKRKHDELSSLAVKSLVCKQADEYAGIPILWRGQEVREVGPIEPLPEHVRQEPYSLPQGFRWVTLSSSDAKEILMFTNKYGYGDTDICYFDYIMMYPNTKAEWQFGIRTTNGKIVGVVLTFPHCISIGGVSIRCIECDITIHPKYYGKRLWYVLVKELIRRGNLYNINHLILCLKGDTLLKPLVTSHRWMYNFNHPTSNQLPSSPRTPGWRRMTSEDVPSALALISKWSSQFEVRIVSDSKEELLYKLLYPAVPNLMFVCVVENETGDITDLVAFRKLDKTNMTFLITALVSTQSSVQQLLTDALVCVKGFGAKMLKVSQRNIKPEVLLSFSFQLEDKCSCSSLYNYRYPEVQESNAWYI